MKLFLSKVQFSQFPFPLETMIEQRGLIFTNKEVGICLIDARSVVAQVKIHNEGPIRFRESLTQSTSSPDRSFKTRDGSEGVFFPKRNENTDSRKVTRTTEKGVFVKKTVSELARISKSLGWHTEIGTIGG